MTTKRRPTRRDLLIVIDRLQHHIGSASMYHGDDRNPEGYERGQHELKKAHELCVEARGYEPPILKPTGPWAAESERS